MVTPCTDLNLSYIQQLHIYMHAYILLSDAYIVLWFMSWHGSVLVEFIITIVMEVAMQGEAVCFLP